LELLGGPKGITPKIKNFESINLKIFNSQCKKMFEELICFQRSNPLKWNFNIKVETHNAVPKMFETIKLKIFGDPWRGNPKISALK